MLTRERSFYRTFFALAGALMLERVAILSVNLADNVMIGSFSEAALAGVAAVNQIQFFLQETVQYTGQGVTVLGSQYWGQKRTEPIRRLSAVGMVVALSIAAVLFVLVSAMPMQLLGCFSDDAAALAEGAKYLNIIRFTYPVFAITTVLLASMRTVENVRLAFGVSVVSLVVNCTINFVLIEGRFGAPRLGVEGAAIGTLTARVLELFIVLFYVLKKDHRLQLKLRSFFHLDRELSRDFFRVATPIIVTGALWGFSNVLQTVILGNLSTNAMTAYSMSSTIYLFLKVAAAGAATAAAVIIGKQIGMGGLDKLKEYVRTLQFLFICIGLVLGLSLFLIRIPLLTLYNVSGETRQLANSFMMLQSLVICTMTYQMPVNTGIIRGGGDTKFVLYMDLISIWGIVLPISFLAAFVWHWDPLLVVLCLNADQIFKCVPAAIRCNSYRWVRKLTH